MSQNEIVSTIGEDPELREMFYDFINVIFPGLDFKRWHELGFWTSDYVPHAILENGRIVSNIGVSRQKVLIHGEERIGIQIGAVGTTPDYRGKGLSRILMEHVLEKYGEIADLFFLYADEDVLDFYPKFGFRRCDGTIFEAESNLPIPAYSARKLSLDKPSDLELMRDMIDRRLDLTRLFGARDYGHITFWHLINVFPDRVHYVEEDDAILISSEKDGVVNVWEVIHTNPVDLLSVLPKAIASDRITRIRYHLPPDQLGFNFDRMLPDSDMPLFVRGKFPMDDVDFKFPLTAHT